MKKPRLVLEDKVLVVTGSALGLGRALSVECAKAGATLILCDKEIRALELLHEEIRSVSNVVPLKIPINFEGATIDDYLAVKDTIKSLYKDINGIIFNAATLGELAPLEHYDPVLWARVFQVNLHSVFLMLKYCKPLLDTESDCNVIFTLAAEGKKVKANWGAYSLSKKGLQGLMEILASEMAQHAMVRVNGVIPTPMNTNLHREAYPAGNYSLLDDPKTNIVPYLELLKGGSKYSSGEIIDLTKKSS